MKTASTFIIAILSFLLMTSCDETKKAIDVAENINLSGSYIVSSINGEKVKSTAPSITFVAIDKTVRGKTGCNSFFGNYTTDLYALSITELAVSEMYCEDEDIQKTERDFLNALNNLGSYSLEDNVLTLYSIKDRSVLAKASKNTTNK